MKVLNVQKTKEIINSKYKYQNWMAFIRLCYRSFLQQSLNEEKCHLETDQSSFLAISKQSRKPVQSRRPIMSSCDFSFVLELISAVQVRPSHPVRCCAIDKCFLRTSSFYRRENSSSPCDSSVCSKHSEHEQFYFVPAHEKCFTSSCGRRILQCLAPAS